MKKGRCTKEVTEGYGVNVWKIIKGAFFWVFWLLCIHCMYLLLSLIHFYAPYRAHMLVFVSPATFLGLLVALHTSCIPSFIINIFYLSIQNKNEVPTFNRNHQHWPYLTFVPGIASKQRRTPMEFLLPFHPMEDNL